MKYSSILFVLIFFFHQPSYSQTTFDTDPVKLQKDFTAWWNYYNAETKLSADFISLDITGKPISKGSFLKTLETGDYIPVRLTSKNASVIYQLYQLKGAGDKGIRPTIQYQAEIEYKYYEMGGKEIPDFNLTDINGHIYNKENTKGKIVVLKCWFIHCVACVQEMPALNKVVQEYKKRKDIVFVSLAEDSKEQLKEFLTTKAFNYAVVADKKDYMTNELKVTEYPTHFILGKNGLIIKATSDHDQLALSLQKAASQ